MGVDVSRHCPARKEAVPPPQPGTSGAGAGIDLDCESRCGGRECNAGAEGPGLSLTSCRETRGSGKGRAALVPFLPFTSTPTDLVHNLGPLTGSDSDPPRFAKDRVGRGALCLVPGP